MTTITITYPAFTWTVYQEWKPGVGEHRMRFVVIDRIEFSLSYVDGSVRSMNVVWRESPEYARACSVYMTEHWEKKGYTVSDRVFVGNSRLDEEELEELAHKARVFDEYPDLGAEALTGLVDIINHVIRHGEVLK